MDATVFTTVFIALWVSHSVGDHWVQTERQAIRKSLPGAAGHLACFRHTASLTLTKAVILVVTVWLLDVPVNPAAVTGALLLDAVMHYWADRRAPLERLARRLGKGGFWDLGGDTVHRDAPDGSHIGTGKYALDQSFHHLWLLVAALIVAVV